MERGHRRDVVVEAIASREEGSRLVHPEVAPHEWDYPGRRRETPGLAGQPGRHGWVEHVGHVAQEGEADEERHETTEALVVHLPENAGDHERREEVGGVDEPDGIVQRRNLVGVEKPPLQLDGWIDAAEDVRVEPDLRSDEGTPKRVARIAPEQRIQ